MIAKDGARLHVIEQGKGDAVLWLQGLNAAAAAWAVQLAHFSQSYRGIAPDARGVGKSGQELLAQIPGEDITPRTPIAPGNATQVSTRPGGWRDFLRAPSESLRAPSLCRR